VLGKTGSLPVSFPVQIIYHIVCPFVCPVHAVKGMSDDR